MQQLMEATHFKPLDIQDKTIFNQFFREDPPQISELTFTNLFIWRHRHRPGWLQWGDCLLIIFRPKETSPFALPPIGPGDKKKALDFLFGELERLTPEGRVCRVDKAFVEKYVDPGRYNVDLDRDNSDYVYLSQDLINLSGRKYHRKKNHLNQFTKNYRFEYSPLDKALVSSCLNMQESWCQMRECIKQPDLLSEDFAVHEALTHFQDLDYRGGAIIMDSKVEAYALGEALNEETAVIHIEKANPDITGLYAAINQRFCSEAWARMTYINREQDLGSEGLRKAKKSYYPHHMVEKYTLELFKP
jgi:hypothetical protein